VSDTVITAVTGIGSSGDIRVTTPAGIAVKGGFFYGGPPGNALNFNGVNNNVTINSPLATDFTVEYWMRTTQTAASGTTWWQGNGIVDGDLAGVQNDFGTALLGNKLSFGVGNPGGGVDVSVRSKTTVNTGNWIFVAAVRNATTGKIKLYINGVPEDSAIAGTAALTGGNTLTFGSVNGGTHFFQGSIDEVRLFTNDRSASIQADMADTVSRNTAGLAAYYDFDEGTGGGNNVGINTLNDLTINAINGTLHSFILNGSTSNWVESYAMVVPKAKAATAITGTGFTAGWSAPKEGIVYNYLLDVATDSAFTAFVTGYNELSVTGASYAVTGLALSTKYYYRLRANKTSVAGEGGYSAVMSVTTAASLLAPTSVGISDGSKTNTPVGEHFRVYPNPAVNSVTVELSTPKTGKYQVQIVNSAGQPLMSKEAYTLPGVNTVTFDISRLASATYYIELVENGQPIKTLKLLRAR
jgi:hypothetical protein